MISRYVLALTVFPLAFYAHAQRGSFLLAETGTLTHISLSRPAKNGGYLSLKIKSSGGETQFAPTNPLLCIPSTKDEILQTGLPDHVEGLSLDSSRCFFRGEYGTPQHTLLFFLSEGYASDAAPLLVIGFSDSGKPFRVLERDQLDPVAFKSFGTNSALVIGQPSLSEMFYGNAHDAPKPYATTYDPFAVYVIQPSQPASFSLSETQRYNLEKYVWHGPRMSEDWAVVYNLPGHPKRFLIPANQLESLFREHAAQKRP